MIFSHAMQTSNGEPMYVVSVINTNSHRTMVMLIKNPKTPQWIHDGQKCCAPNLLAQFHGVANFTIIGGCVYPFHSIY